ncbi:hypothetical protein ES708_05165 [subsurface metagenome]
MFGYVKTPVLRKPKWLKEFLENQSLDIFTWRRLLPTFIEMGFDWLIYILTTAFREIDNAFIAVRTWQEYITGYLNDNFSTIQTYLDRLNSRIDINWGMLNDWFLTRRGTVEGWISAATKPTRNLVLDLSGRVQSMSQDILTLKDQLREPWWSPTRILGAITEALAPFKKKEEDRKNLFEWMWLFFADPPKFLYEIADDVITRFW